MQEIVAVSSFNMFLQIENHKPEMASTPNMILQMTTVGPILCKSVRINGCEVTVSQIYNRYPFLEKIA